MSVRVTFYHLTGSTSTTYPGDLDEVADALAERMANPNGMERIRDSDGTNWMYVPYRNVTSVSIRRVVE